MAAGVGKRELVGRDPRLLSSGLFKAKDYREMRAILDQINLYPSPAEVPQLKEFLEVLGERRSRMKSVPKVHDDVASYVKILLVSLDPSLASECEVTPLEKLTLFLQEDAGRRYPGVHGRNPPADGRGARAPDVVVGNSTHSPREMGTRTTTQLLAWWVLGGLVATLMMSYLFDFERGGLLTIFVVTMAFFTKNFGQSTKGEKVGWSR